ncbi:MAG: type II toxin-antitoxin system PemK/MazF family toxin [Dehalococcoidia bacterium]|nr:Endoribonuclease EndoA [Chloroflexota bacterium]MBT9161097.1 Endoribonuclease EndoA [Chloroflexota bacterium]MBT9162832.1 Endoribonuclease EndoA [Chloroflexota bacterium]
MEVKRGNVFLLDLNPVVGTEQSGIRPALIIQIDRANEKSPHTIIVPFTTKIKEAILPSHVNIPAGVGGLAKDSVLLCEQIRVIDKRRLVRKIGNIGTENLQKVATALKVILGLD